MRRYFFAAVALLAMFAVQAQAQTEVGEKVTDFVGKSKTVAEQTGNKIGDFLGFDDRVDNKEDLVRIKGSYYMPLYDVNLYGGSEAGKFLGECKQKFAARYPMATIQSLAIPQTDWVEEAVMKDKMVVGYTQTMYVFIIAKDCNDGFIDARFVYRKYRDIAATTASPLEAEWGAWDRVDYLTNAVYAKLLTK